MSFQNQGQDLEEGRISLDHLKIGQRAKICDLSMGGNLMVRLLEMGLVPGTEVELIKRAPFGDPLELEVHGYHLSLRSAEAKSVDVELIGQKTLVNR